MTRTTNDQVSYKKLLNNITTFVLDVDGVLTDGTLLVMPDGEFLRSMNIRDGYAMQLCIKKGYNIFIISGGHSKGVPVRLARLGVREVHMGVTNKLAILKDLISKHDLKSENIIYMGDDIPDIEAMRSTGLPCCPADAATEVRDISTYVSPINGGNGCVRDIIEQTMRVQNKWE
jgi:3-deoxy-D-manno-octulosonate 8-phosphate phosphatase (KDO 8-P phosphatase)